MLLLFDMNSNSTSVTDKRIKQHAVYSCIRVLIPYDSRHIAIRGLIVYTGASEKALICIQSRLNTMHPFLINCNLILLVEAQYYVFQ